MKNSIPIAIQFLLLLLSAACSWHPCVAAAWSKTINLGDVTFPIRTTSDHHGGIYLICLVQTYTDKTHPIGVVDNVENSDGQIPIYATLEHYYFLHISPKGHILMRRRMDFLKGRMPGQLIQSPDGILYLTETKYFDAHAQTGAAVITRLTPEGTPRWEETFGTVGMSGIGQLVFDKLGNFYAVCTTTCLNIFGNMAQQRIKGKPATYLCQFDREGRLLQSRQLNRLPVNISLLAYGDDNHIYAAGDTDHGFTPLPPKTSPGPRKGFVACLSNKGKLLWARCFHADADSLTLPYDLAPLPGGGVAVCGQTLLSHSIDGYLLGFSPNGRSTWLQTWSAPSLNSITGIVVTNSHNLFAVGYTHSALFTRTAPTHMDGIVAEYRPTGHLIRGMQAQLGEGGYVQALSGDAGWIYLIGTENRGTEQPQKADLLVQKIHETAGSLPGSGPRSSRDALGSTRPYHPMRLPVWAKPIPTFWSRQALSLFYTSVEVNNKPYIYAGYLKYGDAVAQYHDLGRHKFSITDQSGVWTVMDNPPSYTTPWGKKFGMKDKPLRLGNNWYVPAEAWNAIRAHHYSPEKPDDPVEYDPAQRLLRFHPSGISLDPTYH